MAMQCLLFQTLHMEIQWPSGFMCIKTILELCDAVNVKLLHTNQLRKGFPHPFFTPYGLFDFSVGYICIFKCFLSTPSPHIPFQPQAYTSLLQLCSTSPCTCWLPIYTTAHACYLYHHHPTITIPLHHTTAPTIHTHTIHLKSIHIPIIVIVIVILTLQKEEQERTYNTCIY